MRDPKRAPALRHSAQEAAAWPSQNLGSLELTVGGVAHGGHCVARIPDGPDAGRVVFVRHALPGEKVLAQITDKGKVWRAAAVEVLDNPSPYRVPADWPEGVGGGELAHVSPEGQRRWKAAVVAEQMRRLAGVDIAPIAPNLAVSALTLGPLHHAPYRHDYSADFAGSNARHPAQGSCSQSQDLPNLRSSLGVEPAASWPVGAGYRTRINLVVDDAGQAGMRQARSHRIVPLSDMPLATDQLREFAQTSGVWQKQWPPGSRLTVIAPNRPATTSGARCTSTPSVAPGTSTPRFNLREENPTRHSAGSPVGRAAQNLEVPMLLVDGVPLPNGPQSLVEQVQVAGRTFKYEVAPTGFWQVHATAPETLVAAVLAAAGDLEAHRVLELYSGAGLFTLPLAAAIGPKGKLVTVEGSKLAVENAQLNLANLAAELGPKVLPKAEQLVGSVDRTLARLQKAQPDLRFNTIIVDPPREGLEKGVVEQLASFEPERIIYISCDPAALARDTSRLAQTGYHLTALRAFNLFPNTHHIESVAVYEPTPTSL